MRFLFILFLLLSASLQALSAQARDITVTKGAVTDTATLTYGTILEAVKVSQCGDTITVGPGRYTVTDAPEGNDGEKIYFQTGSGYDYDSGFKNCTEDQPLIIQAKNSAVSEWDGKSAGGVTRNGCLDADCKSLDDSVLSILHGFNSWKTGTNSYITIKGFVLHEIIMALDATDITDLNNPTYFSCKKCTITQNHFNTNYRNCIRMQFADDLLIQGNYAVNCGGDDSGDVAFSVGYGDRMVIQGNVIGGEGTDNGAGFNDTDCNSENWLHPTEGCAGDFHGADGFTIHNEYVCGLKFQKNYVYGLSPNSAEAMSGGTGSDGDASDFKLFKCSDDPVQVAHNIFSANRGEAQVIFHVGASGIDFYNNIIRDGPGVGVTITAGQECSGDDDYGHMKDIRLFGNFIVNNGSGIRIKHVGTSDTDVDACGTTDYRSIENVLIAHNTVYGNGASSASMGDGYGFAGSWAHSANSKVEGVVDGTIKVYNNIFDGNDADENKQIHFNDSYARYYDFKNNLIDGNFYAVGAGTVAEGFYQAPSLSTIQSTYTGNISGDPLFTDSANFDFSLLETSPARNAGLSLTSLFSAENYYAALMLDGLGFSRNQEGAFDIGAVEFVPVVAVPVVADDGTGSGDGSDSGSGDAARDDTDAADKDDGSVEDEEKTSSFSGGCSLRREMK